jgi:predicted outer membrane protein
MGGKLNGLMVVVAGIVLWELPVAAQDRPAAPDAELVGQLNQLGQETIAMAAVGEARGVRPDVKTFAAAVGREHRAMNNGWLVYAQRKNMDMAAFENPGDAMAHGVLALAPLRSGPRDQFDSAFVTRMVSQHQALLDASAAAQRLARDPELRATIGTLMVTAAQRLVSAQQLLAAIPEPTPRVVQLPAYPSPVSRTQTGADEPPPDAWKNVPSLQPQRQ